MAQIALNKPSGGQLLIQPEDGTSTETVTIPSAGVGKILQVVQDKTQPTESYSIAQGTSGAWSNLEASLTTKGDNSSIIVDINLDGLTWTSDNTYGSFYVYRNLDGAFTNVHRFGYPRGWSSVDNASGTTMSCRFIDTPSLSKNTTVSYRFYFVSHYGTSTFDINRDSAGHSTMILEEVAA